MGLDRDTLTGNIIVVPTASAKKLSQFMQRLQKYIQSSLNHPPIRLIIIDSLGFLMASMNSSSRKVSYQRILDELTEMASKNNIAIVIVNELMTQVDGEGNIYFESIGGQAAASRYDRALMFTRISSSKFAARLLKDPTMAQAAVLFEITAEGIQLKRN